MENKTLKVSYAKKLINGDHYTQPQPPPPPPPQMDMVTMPPGIYPPEYEAPATTEANIYVAHLDKNITQPVLEAMFAMYGTVLDAKILLGMIKQHKLKLIL